MGTLWPSIYCCTGTLIVPEHRPYWPELMGVGVQHFRGYRFPIPLSGSLLVRPLFQQFKGMLPARLKLIPWPPPHPCFVFLRSTTSPLGRDFCLWFITIHFIWQQKGHIAQCQLLWLFFHHSYRKLKVVSDHFKGAVFYFSMAGKFNQKVSRHLYFTFIVYMHVLLLVSGQRF